MRGVVNGNVDKFDRRPVKYTIEYCCVESRLSSMGFCFEGFNVRWGVDTRRVGGVPLIIVVRVVKGVQGLPRKSKRSSMVCLCHCGLHGPNLWIPESRPESEVLPSCRDPKVAVKEKAVAWKRETGRLG